MPERSVFFFSLFFCSNRFLRSLASLFGSDRLRNRELGRKGNVEALFEVFYAFVSFLESIKRVYQKLNQLGMREFLELRCVFLVWCSVHPAILAEFIGDFSPSFHTVDSYVLFGPESRPPFKTSWMTLCSSLVKLIWVGGLNSS
jgi:hypothetical protein